MQLYVIDLIGRGERIRTSDPLVPNQVLYQAEPLPDTLIVLADPGSKTRCKPKCKAQELIRPARRS
jgi:hypothetical protein